MPNHDPRAIANEFLKRRDSDARPQQLTIQKLTHIANGWNLAINDQPLVAEEPQAWDNGPVFRTIWDHIKDFGYRGKHYTLVDPLTKEEYKADLTQSERAIIDHVWRKYGGRSSKELSEMTHQIGTPWYNAYFGNKRNARMLNSDMKQHYTELAMAGRANR